MVPASGLYTNPALGCKQVRLAYVLKKDSLTRVLFLLEKAIEKYNKLDKINYYIK